jgi:uncharacterized protein YbjT (DUF2867 family)
MDKLILVTGATGYIASRLIPRLLDTGYRVRALARTPRRLQGRSWFRYVEVVQADVTNPSTLDAAMDGVHTAYYLIHNMSYGHGYTSLELESARAFASAAEKAGVEHIIYLGGLADPEQHIAPHMRSRIETGKVLREGKVPVTEFRAGVITGSGSISFEMIRFMTELFPIVPGPMWMKNKSQPIAIQNVIDYLVAALTNLNGHDGVFEIGGPDIFTYGDLMVRYAHVRGLKRSLFLIPGLPVTFMAFGVGLMTPVPYPIAYALIGGLSADSIVKHPEALKVFPEVKLIDFDVATQKALKFTHPDHIERVWEDGGQKAKSIKHEGCFIIHNVSLLPEKHRDNVSGALAETKHEETRKHFSNSFGKIWIEWRVDENRLTQNLFFSPHGLPGFLYWFLLYPFHWLRFRGLIQRIKRQSKNA